MKIEVAGRIRYPDALVVCSSVKADRKSILDPVVVFRIKSKSTAIVDQMVKNDEYRATPSISRYVMLSQRSVAANIFTRSDGEWVGLLVTDPSATLAMPEIGIKVLLSALYDRLQFDSASEEGS